jgi:hypothetical protein
VDIHKIYHIGVDELTRDYSYNSVVVNFQV